MDNTADGKSNLKEKILIGGGTGLLGSRLAERFASQNYDVIILTRDPAKASFKNKNIRTSGWSIEIADEDFIDIFSGAKAIVNLAGASIGSKRWDDEYKKVIYNSRIDTTKKLVDIIGKCPVKPKHLLSSSAIGIYGDHGDDIITEASSTADDFTGRLCIDWEAEANKAAVFGVNVTCIRTGVVLDKSGGALEQMLTPFKFFAGGHLGSGKQWFSWIHIKDIIELYSFAFENNISGILNGTSPSPVRNKEFCKILGKVISRPSWFAAPKFALRAVLGEFADSVLASQHVIPERAMKEGFRFQFADLEKALKNLLS